MSHLPARTRLLVGVAVVALLAGSLYYFKLRPPSSAAPVTPAPTAPVAASSSFTARASAVCLANRADAMRRAVAIPPSQRIPSRIAFASFDATVRGSVQELPPLVNLTPPPGQAALWGRYLQVEADELNTVVHLRSLAGNNASRRSLSAAGAPLPRLYAQQTALASALGVPACATPPSAFAAARAAGLR